LKFSSVPLNEYLAVMNNKQKINFTISSDTVRRTCIHMLMVGNYIGLFDYPSLLNFMSSLHYLQNVLVIGSWREEWKQSCIKWNSFVCKNTSLFQQAFQYGIGWDKMCNSYSTSLLQIEMKLLLCSILFLWSLLLHSETLHIFAATAVFQLTLYNTRLLLEIYSEKSVPCQKVCGPKYLLPLNISSELQLCQSWLFY
jgi:hypothetical protein